MIKIENLSLKKKIPEISELSLRVEPGEAYVMLSSGQRVNSHLINILAGREQCFSGLVVVDGRDILERGFRFPEHLAFVDKSSDWPPVIRIRDILGFLKRTAGMPADEFEEFKIKMNLDRLGRQRFNDLDEPERRRLLFAVARLASCGNIVIHDLAKGMPVDFILEFKEDIRRLKQKGTSVFYISDDVFFAPEIGDRVGFVKKGKLLLELPGAKVRRMDLKELYFRFLTED
jgi:ABC-type multidrug transport system ATPase subunit